MPSKQAPQVCLDALAANTSPLDLWRLATVYLGKIGFDQVIHLCTAGDLRLPEVNWIFAPVFP